MNRVQTLVFLLVFGDDLTSQLQARCWNLFAAFSNVLKQASLKFQCALNHVFFSRHEMDMREHWVALFGLELQISERIVKILKELSERFVDGSRCRQFFDESIRHVFSGFFQNWKNWGCHFLLVCHIILCALPS